MSLNRKINSKKKEKSGKPKQKIIFSDGSSLSTEDTVTIARDPSACIAIDLKTAKKIEASRQALDKLLEENKTVYGVNTGVGGFVNWLVPTNLAQDLQGNLINAVATNVRAYLENDIVRAKAKKQ